MLRGAPAVAVIAASWWRLLAVAAISQVLCVTADWALGRYAAKRGWEKTSTVVALEGLVDFCAFVWAPVALTFAFAGRLTLVPFATLFVVAGIYRLTRFQAQGVMAGKYIGLPVTYNGYIFPIAALVASRMTPQAASWLLAAVFVVIAWLMATDRFSVPEL